MSVTRPVPYPTPETEPYWAAAREGRLRLPRCAECDRFFWYPRPYCPRCTSPDVRWADVSGRGRVLSYVVNQRAAPGYEAPYPLAIVELDEGPRLLTNILGGGRLELDAPVEVVFEERDGHSVPQFRLCSGGGSA